MGDIAICIRFGLTAYEHDSREVRILANGGCRVQCELASLMDSDLKVIKILDQPDYYEMLNLLTRGPYAQYYSHNYEDRIKPCAEGFVGHIGVALDGLLLPMLGKGVRIYDLYRSLFRLGSKTPLVKFKAEGEGFHNVSTEIDIKHPNNYVLILPEANTVPHELVDWELVKATVRSLGFIPICDTSSGNELYPSLRRRLTLAECIWIAARCRLVINIRSGASDVFSAYCLRQLVIYPPGSYFSMFSLRTDSEKCLEIVYGEKHDLEKAIADALNQIP
jgi:hypothetical protein